MIFQLALSMLLFGFAAARFLTWLYELRPATNPDTGSYAGHRHTPRVIIAAGVLVGLVFGAFAATRVSPDATLFILNAAIPRLIIVVALLLVYSVISLTYDLRVWRAAGYDSAACAGRAAVMIAELFAGFYLLAPDLVAGINAIAAPFTGA